MRNHSLTTLRRPLLGLVSTVLIALAPAACRKQSAAPSPEYDQAHQLFSKLYGQKLDEAYRDPQMDQVQALLAQVPPDSLDAQSAKELDQRIQNGKAKMEKARKEQEDAIASAHQVDSFPSTPYTPEPPATPKPPSEAPKDAGTKDPGPGVGSPASELPAGYLGCFRSTKPINVLDHGLRDAWEMSDAARCSQAYPSFVGQVVLVEEGKVLAVLPRSAVQVIYPDGGTGSDGGR
ncbi:MAG: hypothetical protein ACJ8AT_35290 [Hyalangium sp.]|uniref:hypothetical protein n=1 Tax=Hyalangium sp. TaxID=2028555 RepID=UPI003899B7A3